MTLTILPDFEWTSEAIRELRVRDKRMSQTEFAGAIGVSRVTVKQWESGRHRPGPYAQRRLSALRNPVNAAPACPGHLICSGKVFCA